MAFPASRWPWLEAPSTRSRDGSGPTALAPAGIEPVLTTPIRRQEFLLSKALAALVPSVAIAYAVYAVFLACVELFAQPNVASALLRGPDLLAQVLFTPLLAGWSIWIGVAISTRAGDFRVAQQLGTLASRRPWSRRSSRST